MSTPFEYLSQRDKRWSQLKLGASDLTIGRFGCTTVALTMGLRSFGIDIWPDYFAKYPRFYTTGGLIIWNNLVLPDGFRCEKRIASRNDAEIMASIKDPNKFVLLQVDNGQHWVLALSKTWFGNDYNVADPWFGDRRTACGTYKNITGSAHFIR